MLKMAGITVNHKDNRSIVRLGESFRIMEEDESVADMIESMANLYEKREIVEDSDEIFSMKFWTPVKRDPIWSQ